MANERSTIKAAARAKLYGFLAFAFADPGPATRSRLAEGLATARDALAVLDRADGVKTLEALGRALAPLRAGEFEEAHARCFGNTASGDCAPYEGEYGQAHVFQKTQTLADISGFYHAFGLELAPERHERWDHLSVELEFMHFLATKEAYALAKGHGEERLKLVRDAQAKFLEEHLGRWCPAFAGRLERKEDKGAHAALARLLRAFVRSETGEFGVEAGPEDLVRASEPPAEADAACEGCTTRPLALPAEQGE